jgi:hypothetical protein
MTEQAMKAIERAIAEARLAYRFAPGSYTFAVLTECLNTKDAIQGISWIEEYLDYQQIDAGDAANECSQRELTFVVA